MTSSDQNRPPSPPAEPGDGEELPPLTDDETGEGDEAELGDDLPADEEGDLLDDSTTNEELGLDDLGIDTGHDEEGWTHESEGDESGRSEDMDDLGESEYGWTTDLEERGTDDWDEDLGDGDGSASVLDDDGDEGTDEETNLDITFDPLGTEDDSEDEDDGEPETDRAGFDAEARTEGAELPPHHDDSRVMLRSVGPADASLTVVVASGAEVLGGGQGLYVGAPGGALPPGPSVLEAEDITSIAIGAQVEVAVGTLLGGVLVSSDGGRSFRSANGWAKGSRLSTGAFVCGTSEKLVLRTGDGALFTGSYDGASWTRAPLGGRVLAHAVSAAGLVHALVATPEGPAIATSDDCVDFRLGPVVPRLRGIALAADVHMAAGPDLVLLGADDFGDGVVVSRDGGVTFDVWGSVRCASAIAVDPSRPGTCVLALCFPGRDVAAVVRTTDAGATFSTLFELGRLRALFRLEVPMDAEVENRINGLAFGPSPGGSRSGSGGQALFVASTAGGFVVQVRDEHDLA